MANKTKRGNESKVFTLKRPQFKALASPSPLVKYHCPFHFMPCTPHPFTPRSESYISWMYHVCSCYLSPWDLWYACTSPEISLSGLEKPVGSGASMLSLLLQGAPQSTMYLVGYMCWHSVHLETSIWIRSHKENRYPYIRDGRRKKIDAVWQLRQKLAVNFNRTMYGVCMYHS